MNIITVITIIILLPCTVTLMAKAVLDLEVGGIELVTAAENFEERYLILCRMLSVASKHHGASHRRRRTPHAHYYRFQINMLKGNHSTNVMAAVRRLQCLT